MRLEDGRCNSKPDKFDVETSQEEVMISKRDKMLDSLGISKLMAEEATSKSNTKTSIRTQVQYSLFNKFVSLPCDIHCECLTR